MEDPLIGAFLALGIFFVPGLAASVGGGRVVGVRVEAVSVAEVVSSVAGLALS